MSNTTELEKTVENGFRDWRRNRLFGYSGYRESIKDAKTKVYEEKDLEGFFVPLNELEHKWFVLASAHEDFRRGSCIVGDGFFVLVRPFRARSAFPFQILRTGSAVGSLAWEATRHIIHEDLRALGIDAFYSWGRMD